MLVEINQPKSYLSPLLVHEHDALRTALLPAASISILICLPGHVVYIRDIRAKHLPVITSILKIHLVVTMAMEACAVSVHVEVK